MTTTSPPAPGASPPEIPRGTLTPRERKELIAELTVMVRATAKRVLARVPKNVELDDLLSAGMIGLCDALEKFDQAKAHDIRKYAGIRVKGAILDELRALDPLSRCMRRKARELDHSVRDVGQELGHVPSEDEVATSLGLSVGALRALAAAVEPVRFTSVEAVAEQGGDVTTSMWDRSFTSAQDMLEDKALSDVIERELKALTSRRHEHVLRFAFFDDMSNREIAKVLGVSESRASQLCSEALALFGRRMRAALRHEQDDTK